MAGILIKALISLMVCIFVMFVVYFGMGMVVDTFLFVTSQFQMHGIGLDLMPTNLRIFNWFYLLGGFLALVAFIMVVKQLFFRNRYEDQEDFSGRKF